MTPALPVAAPSVVVETASALLFGVGFGWFLERGGLGNARKIAAQFYLTDMTVLKVMFTAIVTTALGIAVLSAAGVLDPARLYVMPTFVLPQLVGGLVFGVGFVMGGLCPGTSCVAFASGRWDGLALIGGMLVGIVAFNETFPLLAGFYESTPMGAVTLSGAAGIPFGAAVVLLAVIAGAACLLAERIERRAR